MRETLLYALLSVTRFAPVREEVTRTALPLPALRDAALALGYFLREALQEGFDACSLTVLGCLAPPQCIERLRADCPRAFRFSGEDLVQLQARPDSFRLQCVRPEARTAQHLATAFWPDGHSHFIVLALPMILRGPPEVLDQLQDPAWMLGFSEECSRTLREFKTVAPATAPQGSPVPRVLCSQDSLSSGSARVEVEAAVRAAIRAAKNQQPFTVFVGDGLAIMVRDGRFCIPFRTVDAMWLEQDYASVEELSAAYGRYLQKLSLFIGESVGVGEAVFVRDPVSESILAGESPWLDPGLPAELSDRVHPIEGLFAEHVRHAEDHVQPERHAVLVEAYLQGRFACAVLGVYAGDGGLLEQFNLYDPGNERPEGVRRWADRLVHERGLSLVVAVSRGRLPVDMPTRRLLAVDYSVVAGEEEQFVELG